MGDLKPYDPKTMSLKKLGEVGAVPVLPMMPIGAQIRMTSVGVKAHYLVDNEGHYVNGGLPSCPPSRFLSVRAAVASCEDEKSYSETGVSYKKLIVKPDPKHADRFLVKAGAVLIGYGLVDPEAEVVSTDEPIADQVLAGDEDESGDSDDSDSGDSDDE